MKTFAEWLHAEAYDPSLYVTDVRLNQYLKYALGEMEKQLHPLKTFGTKYITVNAEEYKRLISQDKKNKGAFDRGYQAAQIAKAYDKGYKAGGKIEVYNYASNIDIDKLQRENKAARECAMTYCATEHGIAVKAIKELRKALDVNFNEVIARRNQWQHND